MANRSRSGDGNNGDSDKSALSDMRPGVPDSPRKALLAVTEDSGREVVAGALREEGLHVVFVGNLYAALTEFLRHDPIDQPKLVVLSLDGLIQQDQAFLRELRFLSPDVKILILVPEGYREMASRFLDEYGDAQLATPCYASEVRRMARTLLSAEASDPLTRLPNRNVTMRAFEREKARATRNGGNSTIGFALLDLDDFGLINKEYSYEVGDLVLREATRRLRSCFRVTDIMGRWGGEEFIVLLTGLPADKAKARRLAVEVLNRARKCLNDKRMPLPSGAKPLEVSTTGGLALHPHEGLTWEELFSRAQNRLKVGKDPENRKNRKNRIEWGEGEELPEEEDGEDKGE